MPSSVSIHAPVWGATTLKCQFAAFGLFQSTHPCGVRQLALANGFKLKVSIHAPVWGATLLANHQQNFTQFQSTHPCGVRPLTSRIVNQASQFQSTHPCGVRLSPNASSRASASFNPRTRVGCDSSCLVTKSVLMFQSTHPCGVRRLESNR